MARLRKLPAYACEACGRAHASYVVLDRMGYELGYVCASERCTAQALIAVLRVDSGDLQVPAGIRAGLTNLLEWGPLASRLEARP